MALDSAGNVYVADSQNYRIRKVPNAGKGNIGTVAGDGFYSFGGDGGPATPGPARRTAGGGNRFGGNVYIADTANNVVRKVSSSGAITTFAGNGLSGVGGDGGAADGGTNDELRLGWPWMRAATSISPIRSASAFAWLHLPTGRSILTPVTVRPAIPAMEVRRQAPS